MISVKLEEAMIELPPEDQQALDGPLYRVYERHEEPIPCSPFLIKEYVTHYAVTFNFVSGDILCMWR